MNKIIKKRLLWLDRFLGKINQNYKYQIWFDSQMFYFFNNFKGQGGGGLSKTLAN